ncbi:hypothetical protein FQA39_LY13741 [Lamprigera yunnana]|nr:hypothetical protein FQA39_LY13741 [Lamprigera yunnana]
MKPIGILVYGRKLKPNGIDAWQFAFEMCSLKMEWNDINVLRSIEICRERENAINDILFEAEVGPFSNPTPPLSYHNPTAIYNTKLPLNIPPQFPPYCSPSQPTPAPIDYLRSTTSEYSTSRSVQSEHSYGDERPSSLHLQQREIEVGPGADIDYEGILCLLD